MPIPQNEQAAVDVNIEALEQAANAAQQPDGLNWVAVVPEGMLIGAGEVLKTSKKVKKSELPPLELNVKAKDENPWAPILSVEHYHQLRKGGIQLGLVSEIDGGDPLCLSLHEVYTTSWISARLARLRYHKKMRATIHVVCLCKSIMPGGVVDTYVKTIRFTDIDTWGQVKANFKVIDVLSNFQTIYYPQGVMWLS